jgi:hypothetical protein
MSGDHRYELANFFYQNEPAQVQVSFYTENNQLKKLHAVAGTAEQQQLELTLFVQQCRTNQ